METSSYGGGDLERRFAKRERRERDGGGGNKPYCPEGCEYSCGRFPLLRAIAMVEFLALSHSSIAGSFEVIP